VAQRGLPRWRCRCLARVTSGSRGSSGSTSSRCRRLRASVGRRCLVIRTCGIPRPPMLRSCRPSPSRIAPRRSGVCTASLRPCPPRAPILGYRPAGRRSRDSRQRVTEPAAASAVSRSRRGRPGRGSRRLPGELLQVQPRACPGKHQPRSSS